MSAWTLITDAVPDDQAVVTIRMIWPLSKPVEATWDLASQSFTLTDIACYVPWFVVARWKA
jgi:hypothetical protein